MSDGPRILIIDTAADPLAVLGDVLSDLAALQFAATGAQGLEMAQSAAPDLIVLDLKSADSEGFQVLESLKKQRSTAKVPVLCLTDRADLEAESKALVRGAQDVLHKPIRAEAVRSRVELHLTVHRQRLELQAFSASADGLGGPKSQEMAEALRKAERSARERSRFLARVSHELRTPLNTVIGLAQVGLRDAAAGLPVQAHYAGILAAGQQLLDAVNDVIDFSGLQAGLLTVQRQSLDLARTLAQAVQKVEPSAAAKGLSLQVTWQASRSLAVSGEARRVEQVLVHLLSNAVKFTSAGHVHLDVRETPDLVVIDVSDTGSGMTEDELERMFQPFDQLDFSPGRPHAGLGVGLVICRHLAEQMGGTIEVSSLPGEGTEVRFTLMRPKSEEPQARVEPARGRGRLRGVRLLAVEDIEINRFLLMRIFEQEGATFHFEENGRDAIEALAALSGSNDHAPRYDAVLMDVQMPLMDGYEATRRIRLTHPALPVIGLTAHSLPEERARCLESGMVAHLSKPVDVDELVGAVLRACGREVPDWRSWTEAAPAVAGLDAPPQAPVQVAEVLQPAAKPSDAKAATPMPDSPAPAQIQDAQDGPSVIDWQALGKSLGMGEAFLHQLAQVVVRNLQPKPAALRAAAEIGDHAAIRQEAHSVKGIAGNVKAQAAFERAAQTEQAAKDETPQALSLAMALAEDVESMVASAQVRLAA